MTLAEYLEDYATEATRQIGYALIEKEIEKISNEKVKETTIQNLKEIEETVKSVLTNKELYLSLANNSLDSSKKYGTAHLIESIEKILCSGCTSK